MIQREFLAIMQRTLEQLAKIDHEVIRLFHIEEKAIKDIAVELGVPEGTVKRRLHVARKRFREKIELNGQLVDDERQVASAACGDATK